MRQCRECKQAVSEQAHTCPGCGAPFPARAVYDGWGFEYRTRTTLFGLPLLHISFKYRMNRVPVPARGIIAVGQFGMGVITLSQFGIGLISISQFTVAGFAVAQFAAAYSLLAQFGVYVDKGYGQMVIGLADLLKLLR